MKSNGKFKDIVKEKREKSARMVAREDHYSSVYFKPLLIRLARLVPTCWHAFIASKCESDERVENNLGVLDPSKTPKLREICAAKHSIEDPKRRDSWINFVAKYVLFCICFCVRLLGEQLIFLACIDGQLAYMHCHHICWHTTESNISFYL